MPADRAPRSTATRAASVAVLVLALTGCSLFDRDSGAERAEPETSVSASPQSASPSPVETASVSTARETCDRAGELVQDARQRLREEPLALLAEIDDLAETAPPELAEQIAAVREAVEGYRQGDRSFLDVVQEARDLQQLCTA